MSKIISVIDPKNEKLEQGGQGIQMENWDEKELVQ